MARLARAIPQRQIITKEAVLPIPPAPTGPLPGSLLLVGVGRSLIPTLLGIEKWLQFLSSTQTFSSQPQS